MRKIEFTLIWWIISITVGMSQLVDPSIKVYDFDEGLSHRNVFKVAQDRDGFIWVATINGLNRFDGYRFKQYNSQSPESYIPNDVISDMWIDDANQIWLANPDFVTYLNPLNNESDAIQIKQGGIVRRESRVAHSLYIDDLGQIWMAVYDEKSADNYIQIIGIDSKVRTVFEVEGSYIKRPITQWGEFYFIGASEESLWRVDREHQLVEVIDFGQFSHKGESGRIIQLEVVGDNIWVLLDNGFLIVFNPETNSQKIHPISEYTVGKGIMATHLIEEDGDIWMGGRGNLWYWDASNGTITDYHEPVYQLIKNTCVYRQIIKDKTGVIWAATDFGLIKIVPSDDLFSNYLDGGSEYCSNVYCSIRGITEDEEGNIYISYYNSIHVLDPKTNGIKLLFPSNDFFNYPFGLLYHENALWTGNGRRIDLETLEVDTLFQKPNIDLGVIEKDRNGVLWFGFMQWLYTYDTKKGELLPFEDSRGKWDSLDGIITHIYQGKTGDFLWISTLSNGVFQLDANFERQLHISRTSPEGKRLKHNQVNALYEDNAGHLWIATAGGLEQYSLSDQTIKHYDKTDGLPHEFINGILPEGDSILWISTDVGLSRMHIEKEQFTNFTTQDGLSANEFNRISYYKASDGRLFFGGLNGVNAFYPSNRFSEVRKATDEGNIIFTTFSKFDDSDDSLHLEQVGIHSGDEITLTYNEKIFTIDFALADFSEPSTNQYSFILDDYEKVWSPPSTANSVRYNNIPAGKYTFRVRAHPEGKDWLPNEAVLYIHIKEAFYRTWWFWGICMALLIGGMYGIFRYRIYLAKKRAEDLELQVKRRTEELEAEKQKSEELLLNILPAEIADELKRTGVAKAKRHESVTVMFSDFKSFTKISEQMEPEELVAEIDLCFRAFDQIVEKYNLEKIKTIGDAYLCVGGISDLNDNVAVRIIKAAMEIQDFLKETAIQKAAMNAPYFEARIGIHTGPIVAGIVGIKKFVYDIWGDTVNIASRMETNGQVGKVNVSETTYQLVKGHFYFEENGVYAEVEKRPINMYFVENQ